MVRRFIIRHWQGRVALLPSIVLTLVGLRLGLAALSNAAMPWAMAVAVTLAGAVVLVWQIVGTVRAISHESGAVLLGWAGYGAVVFAVLHYVGMELSRYAAQAPVVAVVQDASPRLLPVTDDVAHVSGDIGFEMLTRLQRTLEAHPDLRLIRLTSDGGRVHAARAMAQLVEAFGLETEAVGLCASACTLVFMAGSRRRLGDEGALGFHAYYAQTTVPLYPTGPEEARDRAYLLARGVTAGFVERVFATDHADLWRPTARKLRAAGVLRD